VCTLSDITRQRQRDHALVAREAQILRALDGAPFSLWSVDGRGRISFFAGTAAGDPGRRADLTGQSATELLRGVPEFAEELRRALSGESFTALHEMDGRFYETRFYPSRDSSGKIDGASGISIDVTSRLAAEAEQAKLQDALRHAAEEWRATFDAIDSPLLVLDADDKVQRVNQATRALWEEPYESIIGSRLPDEAPGLPWGAMSHAAARCRATGGTVTLQEWDEATEREWDVAASGVGGPAGVASRVIVMARDVSDVVSCGSRCAAASACR
jgi:PAS domain-containing protein